MRAGVTNGRAASWTITYAASAATRSNAAATDSCRVRSAGARRWTALPSVEILPAHRVDRVGDA